jgi:lambda family phage tail tape measure protein
MGEYDTTTIEGLQSQRAMLERIQALRNEYIELTEANELTNEEQRRLTEITIELKAILPAFTDNVKSAGDSIANTASDAIDLSEAFKGVSDEIAEINRHQNEMQFKRVREEIFDTKQSIVGIKEEIQSYSKAIDTVNNNPGLQTTYREQVKKLTQELIKEQTELERLRERSDELTKSYQGMSDAAERFKEIARNKETAKNITPTLPENIFPTPPSEEEFVQSIRVKTETDSDPIGFGGIKEATRSTQAVDRNPYKEQRESIIAQTEAITRLIQARENEAQSLIDVQAQHRALEDIRSFSIQNDEERARKLQELTNQYKALFQVENELRELENAQRKQESINQNIDDLRREHDQTRRLLEAQKTSTEARERLESVMRAENEARRLGLTAKDAEYHEYIKLATAIEGYNEKIKETEREQGKDPFEELFKSREAIDGAHIAFKRYEDFATNAAANVQEALENSFVAAEDALTEFITTGEFSFKDFAQSIVQDFVRLGVRQFITGPIFGGLGRALIPGFAEGGFPEVGKPAIVGEKGPELFIPQQKGRIISNQEIKNMNSQSESKTITLKPNIYVNLSQTGNAATDRNAGRKAGRQIAAEQARAIQEAQANL